jgi:CDP-diacylglycerol---serine O-phosphatidyltransferase
MIKNIDNQEENMETNSAPKLVSSRFQGKLFLVPTFITVLSIFSGFLAILMSLKGNFEYATQCIAIAFILDGLDGRVARRLNATSSFGKEFDSLSDLVAFGVAPAVLMYGWAFGSVADEFGILISFALVVCGATRLARFNIMPETGKHFVGLPIPAAAGALASYVYLSPSPIENRMAVYFMIGYTLLIASLMVSTLTFFSIKHMKFTDAKRPHYYLLLLSAVVALFWYHIRIALVVIFTGYVLSGIVNYILKKLAPKQFEEIEKAVS